LLDSFFDPSPPLLKPSHIVLALTGKDREELLLPERAIIAFNTSDVKRIATKTGALTVNAWSGFRLLYRPPGRDTVVARSYFGGPNVAALVEELSSFGVKEFVLSGYCGGLDAHPGVGSIILAEGALREDGVSYHYLGDKSLLVKSDWFDFWKEASLKEGFHTGRIWSIDAIYRETADKVARFREMGVLGVEMEVASFYAVCKYKGVKGIAFLVVSDLLAGGVWQGGFRSAPLRDGAKRLAGFMVEKVVR
jgi:uridine phosphorylase